MGGTKGPSSKQIPTKALSLYGSPRVSPRGALAPPPFVTPLSCDPFPVHGKLGRIAAKGNLIEKSKSDLEKETRVAINELRKNFSALVLEAAEKVVNKEIDEDTHSKLIEKFLKEEVK